MLTLDEISDYFVVRSNDKTFIKTQIDFLLFIERKYNNIIYCYNIITLLYLAEKFKKYSESKFTL